MKDYLFLNGENVLFEFSHEYTLEGNRYKVGNLYVDMELLPLEFQTYGYTASSLYSWVESRVAPVGRHHMEAILGAVNLKNKFDVLLYCHGLSLNDTYWVKEKNDPVTFRDINLYDNPFDEALGWIAFTGLPSNISRNLSTPEFTTEGALPKYWQKLSSSNIILTKGGTSGYANAGGEPYSEVIASIIAKKLNINAISYVIDKRNKKVVSISKLFTSKQFGLITMNEYLKYKFNGRTKVSWLECRESILKEIGSFEQAYDMCFFDWLIKNDDRHLNNWGFLVNNETRKIESFSPIWDNGMSLFWSSMEYDFPNAYDYNNYFASFNIPYDFVLECEFRKKYIKLCNNFLQYLNSKEATIDFSNVFGDDTKHNWKTPYVIEMLKRRCNQYISYNMDNGNLNKMNLF